MLLKELLDNYIVITVYYFDGLRAGLDILLYKMVNVFEYIEYKSIGLTSVQSSDAYRLC